MSESKRDEVLAGTVVWIAPFYNRSGYGVGARATVAALHHAGVRIRTFSVNEVEPGIDDCDLSLIKSLEATPLIPPITAVVTHVPSMSWLGIQLPEPNLRIIATTFDSSAQGNLPPPEWIAACSQMDQLWLMSEKERDIFVAAGIPSEKIHFVHWPHHWHDNPVLPPISAEPSGPDKPFRFLSIAMFQPRRRWDALIEAYLEEFRDHESVELYLKVNFPSWHPVPGQPRQDLHDLVSSLRRKTGSKAPIVIDEDLGTRLGIVRLIDSCNVYVSTDTATTAPMSEARVRERLVIAPAGLGVSDPPDVAIAVDPDARLPLTPDMLLYQPHHKEAFMPQLHIQDVRHALRRAFDMPPAERQANSSWSATLVPRCTTTVPEAITAIKAGWQQRADRERKARNAQTRIRWEGSQLVRHSLALVNRELCLGLMDAGFELSILPYEKDDISPDADPRFDRIVQRTRNPLSGGAHVHVRHQWPPDFRPPEEGHWVIIQPWEFGSLPKAWTHPMSHLVDEMWVPTSFVRECFIRSGIPADRVFVVPLGVDTLAYHPAAEPFPLSTRKRFKYLFVGGTIFRKGIDALLDAYVTIFSDLDDVCLVIKDMGGGSFYKDQTARRMIEEHQARPGAPEIEYIERMLDEKEMAGLYTACDCLVHPYRGEGFGLPIAEAMACELPVIVTGYGAALDFCSEETAYLLPFQLARFSEKRVGDLETVDFPWLAEPDREALKETMKRVFEDPEAARARGKAARTRIEGGFTWGKAADAVEARINALLLKPVRKFEKGADGISDSTPWTKEEVKEARRRIEPAGPPSAADRPVGIAGLLNEQGELQFQRGRLDHARACFEMAIENDPAHATAHSNLGVIYWQEGELNKALEYFQQALELSPGDPDILLNSAKALQAAGEMETAAELLKAYLKINPRDEAAWEDYDRLARQVGGSGWKPDGLSREVAGIYLEMSERLAGVGDILGAAGALQRVLKLDPDRPEACLLLGRLHLELGQEDEALEILSAGLEASPFHKESVLMAGSILASLGREAEAGALYEAFLAHRDDEDIRLAFMAISASDSEGPLG